MQLIKDATIINEGKKFVGSVLINGEKIETIYRDHVPEYFPTKVEIIEAKGMLLLPGVIDDQVHFREPGLTHKGDIFTESRAAVAGGITSYFEMPNTKPQTTTIELLNEKFELASAKSLANFTFLIGATNNNIEELNHLDPRKVAGVKVFMGSSTGNMLVDRAATLNQIFAEFPLTIITHCEDETIIQSNLQHYKNLYGNEIPIQYHPMIRNEEACYKSSSYAVELATKYNSRLHVFHLSTARELSLFSNKIPLKEKKITSEVCLHHLWFSDLDYHRLGNKIKWNPAIKKLSDKEALIQGVKNNLIDIVATDHAPHTWAEKDDSYLKSASGGPMVQHLLIGMLQMVKNGTFQIEQVVEKLCHAPATLFKIEKRAYIREGYFADLVLIDPNKKWTVEKSNLLYKCRWSAMEGETFDSSVIKTWVNGHLVFNNGHFDESKYGSALTFNNC